MSRPCPICDSTNVRWRGRRFYDIPLTWARTLIEALWSGVAVNARMEPSGGNRELDRAATHDYGESVRAEHLEAATGHATPSRFWRCRACGGKGHVFDATELPAGQADP
jgi:hypothetical protein